jgi:hypothetical protein
VYAHRFMVPAIGPVHGSSPRRADECRQMFRASFVHLLRALSAKYDYFKPLRLRSLYSAQFDHSFGIEE